MMSLFIDMQGAQTSGSRDRGIGRYSRDLVCALAREKSQLDTIYLGWNTSLISPIEDLTLPSPHPDRPRLISAPFGALERERFAFDLHDFHQDINHRLLANAVAVSDCRHVLFTSIMEADEPNFVLPKHLNFTPFASSYSIVYDIIPLLFKEQYLASDALLTRYMSHLSVKTGADVIFTISEQTRQDLTRVLDIDPKRVVTIGAGIDPLLFNTSCLPDKLLPARLGLHKPFLLFMGGDEFRKNIKGFVAAMVALPQAKQGHLQALFLGKVAPQTLKDLQEVAKTNGLASDTFVFREYLPHDELMDAYRLCAASVIPSIYEGFGLPVLEAMACGTVVLASKNTSMAEIVQDSRFLFDSADPTDIAAKIDFALTQVSEVHEYKQTYKAKIDAHSWGAVAQRVLAAMVELQGPGPTPKNLTTAPRSIAIATFGRPTSACLDVIKSFAHRNDVRVYFATLVTQVETLPVTTDLLANLWKHAENDTPVFGFFDSADNILLFLKHHSATNIVAILDEATAAEWYSFPPEKRYKSGSFYAIWLLKGGIVKILQSIGVAPLTTMSLQNTMIRAMDTYRLANTLDLARDIKLLLSKTKNSPKMLRKISERASVTVFDVSPIHPTND